MHTETATDDQIELMPAPRFLHTDYRDGASEVLTLVRLVAGPFADKQFTCRDLDGAEYPYLVQIATGPEPDDDFVGLYDLDGDQVDPGNMAEWEIVTHAPAEVIAQIESSWDVERLEDS